MKYLRHLVLASLLMVGSLAAAQSDAKDQMVAWQADVLKKVLAAWKRPTNLTNSITWEMRVKTDNSGRLLNLSWVTPTGNRSLDRSIVHAFKDAAPYPAPPDVEAAAAGIVFTDEDTAIRRAEEQKAKSAAAAAEEKVRIAEIKSEVPYTTAFAQTANGAVMGLKKLEAKCQIGISYRDYSSALADAKFPVNIYTENSEAMSHPALTKSINSAIHHYEFANSLWNAKFSADRRDLYLSSGFISAESHWGTLIKEQYPQISLVKNYYGLDMVLPIIWSEASKEIDFATKLYSAGTSDKSNDIERLNKENEQMRSELELEKLKKENEELKKQLQLKNQTDSK